MEIQKAFKLSVKNIVADEPWHYTDIIVYADSHGEAKAKGISEWHFESAQVEDYTQRNYKGEYLRDITFLDIRARRVKQEDKILYKDRWETRGRVSQLQWQDKRDEEAKQIWTDNPDGVAIVWAGCYNQYWGANHSGYTSDINYAGKYSTEEALKIVKGSCFSRQEKVILIDKEKYNKELKEKANKLLKNMI